MLILTVALAQVSDDAVEAARDLGSSGLRIFSEILLPQMQRGLQVSFCFVFLGIFGSYTIPYLLGPAAPEMMGVFMQRTFYDLREFEAAQVQAVLSFLVCAFVSLFYIRSMIKEPS